MKKEEPKPEEVKKEEPQQKPPEKEPEAKPKAPEALAKAKPKRKPKPPDAFDSVLKTVEELKKSQPRVQDEPDEKEKEKKKKAKKAPEESFEELIAKALPKNLEKFDTSQPISISEIDLVRQQIAGCWSLPAGAKDAENMEIEIAVNMNPDGSVRDARILNKNLQSDPFLRSMAESALRAVLNSRCQPFKLPRSKFDRWNTMTLVFNPKEMFVR